MKFPVVTFQFDDGNATDLAVMAPVFARRKVPACSALITSRIGQSGYLAWDGVRRLTDSGWEMLCHTHTHPDLTRLNPKEIDAEFENSIAAAWGHGIHFQNAVYPYLRSNEQVRESAMRHFRSARGRAGHDNTREDLQLDCLSGVDLDGADLARCVSVVDYAVVFGCWLVFFAHKTTQSHAELIGDVLDYILARGIPVVTAIQALL